MPNGWVSHLSIHRLSLGMSQEKKQSSRNSQGDHLPTAGSQFAFWPKLMEGPLMEKCPPQLGTAGSQPWGHRRPTGDFYIPCSDWSPGPPSSPGRVSESPGPTPGVSCPARLGLSPGICILNNFQPMLMLQVPEPQLNYSCFGHSAHSHVIGAIPETGSETQMSIQVHLKKWQLVLKNPQAQSYFFTWISRPSLSFKNRTCP